jgi:small subunit ribosomal protein S7
MPRKGHTVKRTVPADAVYGSNLVTKFINSMMWQGKRSTAEGIFYEALGKVQEKAATRRSRSLPRQLKTRNRCSK